MNSAGHAAISGPRFARAVIGHQACRPIRNRCAGRRCGIAAVFRACIIRWRAPAALPRYQHRHQNRDQDTTDQEKIEIQMPGLQGSQMPTEPAYEADGRIE